MRDALGNVQSVLVLDAGSDVARRVVQRLVARRTRTVALVAPATAEVDGLARELRTAGATVEVVRGDAHDATAHAAIVDEVFGRTGDIDLAVLPAGATAVAVPVAERMRRQGHGAIVAVSPTGDPDLPGLRDRLAGHGVTVTIVRPGDVIGSGRGTGARSRWATTPDAVADAIVEGLARGSTAVWVPPTLRYATFARDHFRMRRAT